MAGSARVIQSEPKPVVLKSAPSELTEARLRRLGEGIGRVAYASEHWVVRRERSPCEVVALIAIWKLVRSFGRIVPGRWGEKMLENPSRKIRVLRILMQTIVRCTPSSFWLDSYIGKVWRTYHRRSVRGEKLARTHLSGTALIPAHIAFPPQKIRVKGWPRSIMVSEATERVECTLYQRLSDLARERRFAEVELWLNRLLDLRQAGWKRGLFSVDTHLKNFGVTADRVVLLDSGGLTDRWHEVESRLAFEDVVAEPHIQLGLGRLLGGTPEIAQRFNARWKSVVNPSVVRHHWSGSA